MLQIALIKIPVHAFDAALPFYTALGLRETFRSDEWGWLQTEGTTPPVALYLAGKGGGDGAPGGAVEAHFAHPDLEALETRIAPLATSATLARNADGTLSLDLVDPSGTALRVMQAG